MGNYHGSYFGKDDRWVLEKWTPKQIALFMKKGPILFGKLNLTHTEKSKEYLEENPEFARLFEEW